MVLRSFNVQSDLMTKLSLRLLLGKPVLKLDDRFVLLGKNCKRLSLNRFWVVPNSPALVIPISVRASGMLLMQSPSVSVVQPFPKPGFAGSVPGICANDGVLTKPLFPTWVRIPSYAPKMNSFLWMIGPPAL